MVQKKPSVSARTNITTTTKLTTSTLLTSAFSPAYLHLSLFASTILGLDAHRLRIHDTVTGRLRCEHTFEKGVSINSLAWGSIPAPEDRKGSKKKRKRVAAANGEDAAAAGLSAIVAVATSKGSVLLFSPSEGTVVGALEGGHLGEVRQFVFSGETDEGKGWSCGVDGKLVEWDLRRKITMRTINLPDPAIQRLAYTPPSVLCASHTVYAISYANPGMAPPAQFTANTTPIHSIFSSNDNTRFLSAADSDRFINVFSIPENKNIGALVAESDVNSISVFGGDVLVAITIDGVVELFKNPYEPAATLDPSQSPTASRKRKAITRKGDAKVKIIRPDSSDRVNVADASIQGEDLVIAWVESGVNMEFEKIKWSNPEDGSLVLNGLVEISRSNTVRIGGGGGTVMNGVKDMGKASVDQSKSVVIGGVDTQDVGMEDAADVSEDEEEPVEEDEDEEDEEDEEAEREAEEPSFAEKFQALEVSTAAKTATSTALTTTTDSKKVIQPPSAGSLTTVLTQALKTNDTALLESCLHATDSNTILATVRRLNSTMAVSLLERLAERIARRPGRAGSLGIWVRWTLVAHGGYLVSLPDLMSTLSGLYSTLNTRAGALPRLLALQGRLDMLHAQVDLRKALRSSVDGGVEGDADKGVLYVEGQEQDSSDEGSDEEPEEVGMQGLQIEDASFIGGGGSVSGSDEDMVNGVESSEEDEDEDDEDEDEDEERGGGFFDIEASEASEDEDEDGDEDEVDYDDVDAKVLDTDEEEEVVSKPKFIRGLRRC